MKAVLNIHWKDWYWSWNSTTLAIWCEELPHLTEMLSERLKGGREDWRWEEKGMTEGEMVGWHHWLNGHECELTPGVNNGQGSLACCSPWGHKESWTQLSDWTELNWTEGSSMSFHSLIAHFFLTLIFHWAPRWHSGKEFTYQFKRHRRRGFNPWARKIPWRGKWQPTPVFSSEKFHGQKSLVGYSPWGHKESGTTENTHTHTHTHTTWIYHSLFMHSST